VRSDDLARTYSAITKTKRGIKAVPRDLEQRERAIMDDEDLTAESRAIKIRQVRDESRAKQGRLHDDYVKLCAKADRLEAEATIEGGTREAHSRVQQLLGNKVDSAAIIKRAEGLRDYDTIQALRAEVHYLEGEDGFVDAKATVEACNRALARLGRDDEEKLVGIADARTQLAALDEFAAKSVHTGVTPHDRLVLGFALGPDSDDHA
jgi:hypothetical protein